MSEGFPTRAFATREEFRKWLDAKHATAPGIWVKFAKKASGIRSVDFQEALEVALCYGWIDGLRRGVDDDFYVQRFTPRRARSRWSKINRAHAERLIEAGAMQPAGLAEIARAKADGRWDAAYDSPSTITVPPDLEAAFERNPKAKSFFETLNSTNRYAVLYRIQEAKKAETRARRIARFVEMMNEGKTLY